MDTSEKYILMCEKAEEVQKECPLKQVDHYKQISSSSRVNGITIVLANFFHVKDENLEWFDNSTWLPRQDQLQEMVEDISEDNVHRIFRFDSFIRGHYLPITNHSPYIYFINLVDRDNIEEILWLAFVMHEKYQKQWDEGKEEWTGQT